MDALNFRQRQLLTLLMLAILPLILALSVALPYARGVVIRQATMQLEIVAELKALQLRKWLEQGSAVAAMLTRIHELRDTLLELATAAPDHRQGLEDQVLDILHAHTSTFLQVRSISLLDPDSGQVMVASEPILVGRERHSEPYFNLGREQLFIGSIVYSVARETPILNIAAPIKSNAGELLAVVAVEMNLSDLESHIQNRAGLGADGRAYLVDAYGFYVTVPRPYDGSPLRSMARSEGIRRILSQESGSGLYDDPAGDPVLGVYRWLPESKLGLLVEMDEAEVIQEIARMRQVIYLLACMLLIATVIAARYLNQRLVKPLTEISQAAMALRDGDRHRRVPLADRRDEFDHLGEVFNRMAESLQHSHEHLEQQVTQRTAELKQEKERAQVTLHSIGDAVIVADANGRVEFMNPMAEKLSGWPLTEAHGQALVNVFRIVDEHTREALPSPAARCLAQGEVISLERSAVLITRTGDAVAVQSTASPIRDDEGRLFGVVLVFSDITEIRQLTSRLSFQASHDALTGLINRLEFERRLIRALTGAREHGAQHVLCLLDLDRFKAVNDTVGHQAGDELLRQVVGLLQAQTRDRDTFARLGGDEFALLLENCPLDKAATIARGMVTVVGNYRFVRDQHTFRIGVSIGMVAVSPQVNDVAELMAQADQACYAAKRAGGNGIQVHESDADSTPRQNIVPFSQALAEKSSKD